MAAGLIPITKANYDFEMRIDLGNGKVTLRIYYNTRANAWHMDLVDLRLNEAVYGIVLMPEHEINPITETINWGTFYLQDTDPNSGDYQRDDLGSRLLLMHYTAQDLEDFETQEALA